MSTRVSEVVARPVRGAGQSAVAFAIVEFIDALGIYTLDGRAYGAAVVLLSLILSGVQVLIENASGTGLLRKVPPTKVPVVDSDPDSPGAERMDPMPGRHGWRGDGGGVDVGTVILIALAVLGVLFIVGRL